MSIKENVLVRTTGGDMILDVVVEDHEEEDIEDVLAVVVLSLELELVYFRMEGVMEEEETGRVVG
jgi:hypothetical protein